MIIQAIQKALPLLIRTQMHPSVATVLFVAGTTFGWLHRIYSQKERPPVYTGDETDQLIPQPFTQKKSTRQPPLRPIGFSNPSNTACGLNSLLVLSFSCPNLRKLLQEKHPKVYDAYVEAEQWADRCPKTDTKKMMNTLLGTHPTNREEHQDISEIQNKLFPDIPSVLFSPTLIKEKSLQTALDAGSGVWINELREAHSSFFVYIQRNSESLRGKSASQIDLPSSLTLNNQRYELIGFAVHQNLSPQGTVYRGHWMAFVHRIVPQTGKTVYFHVNDSISIRIPEEAFYDSRKSCSLALYTKQEIK